MKRLLSLLLISSALVADEKQEDPLATLASNNAQFGWNLYEKVSQTPGNICVSPYSVSSALIIPYVGAKDDTAKQMRETLQFNQPSPLLEQNFGKLNAFLTRSTSNYPSSFRVLVANSIWVQEQMRISGKYLAQIRKDFRSTVQRVDFINETEASRGKINRWVAHQTNNKIQDLIGQGVLKNSTRMVVVSALYLKAKWMTPFPKSQTRLDAFFPQANKTLTVPMMYKTANFPYFEQDQFQLVELALEQPDEEAPQLVMDFVLPKERDGIASLEETLSLDVLNNAFEKMQNEDVSVTLPKFKLHQSVNLTEILQSMGMKIPFTVEADFSGITGSKDLMIGEVVHQTYLDVAETGVEAAAATAASMNMTAILQPNQPKVFKADHPFLVLLRERKTGTVLFIGRLNNP